MSNINQLVVEELSLTTKRKLAGTVGALGGLALIVKGGKDSLINKIGTTAGKRMISYAQQDYPNISHDTVLASGGLVGGSAMTLAALGAGYGGYKIGKTLYNELKSKPAKKGASVAKYFKKK